MVIQHGLTAKNLFAVDSHILQTDARDGSKLLLYVIHSSFKARNHEQVLPHEKSNVQIKRTVVSANLCDIPSTTTRLDTLYIPDKQ